MTNSVCCSCHKPKAPYACELCAQSLCKSCAQFMAEDSFSFLKNIPADLSKSIYCPACYDSKVAGPMADYEATMEKARSVAVFYKDEGKKTRLFPRKEAPYATEECEDEEETVLRLAFFAAADKFNAILDVNLTSRKIVIGSHKKLVWKGTAMPVNLDERTLSQEYYD